MRTPPLLLLVTLVLIPLGCDDERRPDQPLAGWTGPPPRIQIVVEGSDADEDKRQKCQQVIVRSGGLADPTAPVRAVLTLRDEGNRLQVISQQRGIVRDEPRPGWDMEHLCNDALLAVVSALRQEFGPPTAVTAAPL